MTRFARAKGSKASNERAPEDGTPWEVMKEQLLHSKKESEDIKKRQEAEKQRIQNYQSFLNEKKIQKKKATWCDFPLQDNVAPPKKKKKKSIGQHIQEENQYNDNTADLLEKKTRKKKMQNKTDLTTESGLSEIVIKRNLKSKQNKKQNEAKLIIEDMKPDGNKIKQECKPGNVNNIDKCHKKKKPKKLVDGKPIRRKEINDRSFELIINGKDVQLVRFDGFPIMKKDAERLQELRNSMIKKGIPKNEVQRTMKLERRRAEKALARLKRDVCYNCRKGGHNLSDCPDLKSKIPGVDAAEGVCFKCGSTEHKQFECKVQKDKDFKFATCFICKEPGHIARQCPDNPKGLYPNGGSCKLCGDVTHLRKDCPTIQEKREETSLRLQTLDSDNNIEGIGVQDTSIVSERTKKPKKIKF